MAPTGGALTAGIELLTLSPQLGDFNGNLRVRGIDNLQLRHIRVAPQDVVRFMLWAAVRTG
jgi:hypothetical protein